MEPVACILCGSAGGKARVVPSAGEWNADVKDQTFTLITCPCGFTYLNPRPTRPERRSRPIIHRSIIPRPNSPAERRWHLRFAGRDILPFESQGRLLDVGCGPGRLLQELRGQGWDVYGVDFSPVAVSRAQSIGLNVKECDLLTAGFRAVKTKTSDLVSDPLYSGRVRLWGQEQVVDFPLQEHCSQR